jgi:hypothetical protein
MKFGQGAASGLLMFCLTVVAGSAGAQTGAETFTATAGIKTAAGAAASAPVTVVVSRKMSHDEVEKLAATFTTGGAAALRKALAGAATTGSIQLGGGAATPTRLAFERTTDRGRLLTVVADQPIMAIGAGLPGAKPKAGYDFAILDLMLDAQGSGAGTFAPAAKIGVKQGAFVVEDYASEMVKLTDVKKSK